MPNNKTHMSREEQRRRAAKFMKARKVAKKWEHLVDANNPSGKRITFHVEQNGSIDWKVTIVETQEVFEGQPFACVDWIEGQLERFGASEDFGVA